MPAVQAHNVFEKNNVSMNKAMEHVTTGQRVNSAKDNAANYTISERMRERINSLNQAQQNVQNDTAMMKTAEGAITNTVDLLRSAKALVVQAVDASANDNDRLAISKQLTKIFEQIDDNANTTKYNGKLLLAYNDPSGVDTADGDSSESAPNTLTFQVGDESGTVISGVQLQNMTLAGLSLSTAYGEISALADASGAGAYYRTTNGAYSSLGVALNTAYQTALDAATDVGAYGQRLDYTADKVSTQIENLEVSDSAIRDADMAKEISNFMKYSVLSQAAQYMMAQGNQNAFSVLNLLQ